MSASQGEPGVAGRQGEAGVAGPQGEAGQIGQTGSAGKAGVGVRGPEGQRGASLSNSRVLAVFFVVVVAFVTVAFRTEIQQRQIQRNSDRIEHVLIEQARTQYDICSTRNATAVRQNALIDNAIAAEKRKPKPDAQRIKDLTEFRSATPSCGKRP